MKCNELMPVGGSQLNVLRRAQKVECNELMPVGGSQHVDMLDGTFAECNELMPVGGSQLGVGDVGAFGSLHVRGDADVDGVLEDLADLMQSET